MSEPTKHTQGPYTIDDRGQPIGADILAVVDNWSTHPCRIAHVAPFKNYPATARLFAAAPEMYLALNALVADDSTKATPEIRAQILAAIRKAESGD